MPIRVAVTVSNDKQLIAAFRDVLKHVENLEQVWQTVEPLFRQIMREQFDSEGAAGRSGAWKELTPAYAEIKRKLHGDKPILQATGRLEKSLTGRTADSITTVSKKSVGFGTTVPYALFHQYGTKRMIRRPIIDLSDEQERRMAQGLTRAVEQEVKRDATVSKMLKVTKR